MSCLNTNVAVQGVWGALLFFHQILSGVGYLSTAHSPDTRNTVYSLISAV